MMIEAILYARKYLSPLATTNLPEIQYAMGALAFTKNTTCPAYMPLFEEKRWRDLVRLFDKEMYLVHCLPTVSLLSITLEAGLSALKTPFCEREDDRSLNCPLCHPDLATLAKSLPYAHHIHSSIVCRLTGQIMNEDNPPMVLPNGNVYSRAGLEDMAMQNQGILIDPRSGERFRMEEAKKVYIS